MSEVGAQRLVFVGALPRSGMSRLTEALAQHPQVSVLDPAWDPAREPEEVRRVFSPSPRRLHGSPMALPSIEHMTESSPYCTDGTRDALWLSWGRHFDVSRPVLLQPWPTNLTRSRFLQALFPSSSFIMLERHPLVVVEGVLRQAGMSRPAGVRYWLGAYDTMADDLAHIDRGLVIRYEDLLFDQDLTFALMLQHLQLEQIRLAEPIPVLGNEQFYDKASRGLGRSGWLSSRPLERRVARHGYLLRAPFVIDGEDHAATPAIQLAAAAAVPAVPASAVKVAATAEAAPTTAPPRVQPRRPDVPYVAPRPLQAQESPIAATPGGELRRAAKGGVAFTSGIVVNALFQFVFVFVLAHLLNQSAVGALLVAVAAFTICSLTFGADTGLLRFAPIFRRRRPRDLGRLFAVALLPVAVVSPIVATLVFVFAPQLVHVFVHNASVGRSVDALRILACCLPAASLTTIICAGLRAWSNRPAVLLQSFLQSIGRVVLLGAFAVAALNLTLAAIAYTAPIAVSFVLAFVLLIAKLRLPAAGDPVHEPARSSWRTLAEEFWGFSGPSFFGLVFQTIILQLDVLLVGAFLSVRLAAAYSVASRYVIAGTFGLQAIISSVSPQLSRLMDAGDYVQAKLVYTSSTWWAIAASWPILLVLAVYGPLFQRLFGHGYTTAAVALAILALAMLVNTGTGPNGSLLYMAGHAPVALGIWGVGLALNVGLNVWLIPVIGLKGAALAWAATILEVAVATNTFLWVRYRIQPFGMGYLKIGGAALGCFGALGLLARWLLGLSSGGFVVFAIVSVALYGSLLLRWRNDLNLAPFESLSHSGLRQASALRRRLSSRVPALLGRGRGY